MSTIISFQALFPDDTSNFITSLQYDLANPDNFLVSTWYAIYTVPIEGTDGAKHLVGNSTRAGESLRSGWINLKDSSTIYLISEKCFYTIKSTT